MWPRSLRVLFRPLPATTVPGANFHSQSHGKWEFSHKIRHCALVWAFHPQSMKSGFQKSVFAVELSMFSCLTRTCFGETINAVHEYSFRSYQRQDTDFGDKINMKMIGLIVSTHSDDKTVSWRLLSDSLVGRGEEIERGSKSAAKHAQSLRNRLCNRALREFLKRDERQTHARGKLRR